MYNRRKGLCAIVILVTILYSSNEAEAQAAVVAYFRTSGFNSGVKLNQSGSDVRVDIGIPSAQWQIHELQVDFSIDPKLRCRPEHVGRLLHSGRDGEYIYNVTAISLVLHSIVLIVDETPVACGTIFLRGVPVSLATVKFKSGVFGRMYIEATQSYTYVDGIIQTEKEFECNSEETTSYISIAMHNATLGPYDTVAMRNGCDVLNGGATIMNISVNCQSNVTFSQLLSEPLLLSSYLGHALSVQNSSGAILGCGRLETLFPVYASYRGKIIFFQESQYFLVPVWGFAQFTVLEGIAGTCSSQAAIFDPWNPPPKQVGPEKTADQFKVGDLSNRNVASYAYVLEVPLIGSATILGHAINDSRPDECNSLELAVPASECNLQHISTPGNGYIVKGYAEFHGPNLTGNVTFTEAVYLPDRVVGPTIITVDLSYTDSTQATIGNHVWNIHKGFTDGNGTCASNSTIGALYNPYAVKTTVESGYLDACNSQRQLRCAMGDLSRKLGALELGPVTASPHKTYSFYDEHLFLAGPFSIFGRSIVVYGTGAQSGQLFGCANIEPSLKTSEDIKISFPRNGRNQEDIDRVKMGHSLSSLAEVPEGDVLVNDVQAVNISGSDCLTASLWITGLNVENASQNAGKVSTLDRQKLGNYSAGPCVPSPNETTGQNNLGLGNTDANIIIISVLVSVLILLIVLVGALLIIASRRKQRMFIYAVEGQEGTRNFSPALVKLLPSKGDQWELLGSHFKVGTKLGEGNYGQVYKGTLSVDVAMTPAKRYIARQTRNGKAPYIVAIKLLKGGADERAVENFLEEIAMMKKVSSGECCHVVQMVGCVSTALPLALALEFVPFGDLLSYLKYWGCKSSVEPLPIPSVHLSSGYDKLYCEEDKEEAFDPAAVMDQESIPATSRGKVLYNAATLDQEEKCTVASKGSLSEPCLLQSSCCDKPYPIKDRVEQSFPATTQDQESFYSTLGEPDLSDLPSFAYQISLGMEYLSSLGVLHRDLACRNILVDERKLLKISDFGLSRDTPEYVSSLKDKMPLRWMAPETVTDNVFTDKSDVWSFGVCLWEMYTLGGTPYEDVPMASLMARIISGYRLHMPELSSDKMYQLMLLCWSSEPEARLNFTQLKFFFKSIITAANKETNYITIQP